MEQISILSGNQKAVLECIRRSQYIIKNFYFTGGTALSEFYMHHRYSDDLDFFSNGKVDQEIIFAEISEWSRKLNFRFSARFAEVVYRFDLQFTQENFKVDFGYYPYPQVEKGIKYQELHVDSLRDIATNKLLTVSQRTDVKDFVDLYFLLKENFTLWDLIYGVEAKFKNFDFDILLLAEDLLKVDDFNTLPRMIKRLDLDDLKIFFRKLAKEVGKKAVE